MKFFLNQSKMRDVLFILIGTLMMAIAVNMVYDPLGMVTGGVTGIGIVIKHLTQDFLTDGIPVWLTNALCNVPLFLAAILILGKRFLGQRKGGAGETRCPLQIPGFGTSQQIILAPSRALIQPPG